MPASTARAAGAPRVNTLWKIPRSVLVVIHTVDLQVLLMERASYPGFWQSVTGSLDREDEPLRAAATREVGEETGLDAGAYLLEDWDLENRFEIFARGRGRFAPGITHNREHVFGLTLPPPARAARRTPCAPRETA